MRPASSHFLFITKHLLLQLSKFSEYRFSAECLGNRLEKKSFQFNVDADVDISKCEKGHFLRFHRHKITSGQVCWLQSPNKVLQQLPKFLETISKMKTLAHEYALCKTAAYVIPYNHEYLKFKSPISSKCKRPIVFNFIRPITVNHNPQQEPKQKPETRQPRLPRPLVPSPLACTPPHIFVPSLPKLWVPTTHFLETMRFHWHSGMRQESPAQRQARWIRFEQDQHMKAGRQRKKRCLEGACPRGHR